MATDTARIQLELASGRNEVTAPFYQTAQRRRSKQLELDAAYVEVPIPAQTVVEVPLAPAATSVADVSGERRGRTPWVAFAIALVSVGFAVWWVMAQRMPEIDPRDVIARNLDDARIALANGRYTDPPERSAFHYFSTVLAIDPANADAIAGVDVIAARHLSNARMLLSQGRLADAGVALEKARRVRPDHEGLAALDTQWRAELRKLLAAATAVTEPRAEVIEKPVVVKASVASESAAPAKIEPAPLPKVADVAPLTAMLAANPPSTWLQATAEPVLNTAANIVEANPVAPEPQTESVATTPASVIEPKLIRMVQPQYPQEALMRGVEGWVDVSLQVTASGDVVAPRVEDSSRGRLFNRAALAAVEQWKYEPRSDGVTSDRVRVRLKFERSR